MFELRRIRRSLESATPRRLPAPGRRADHAAVAMVLSGTDGALRLCFIRRARRSDDPWSGQMAFPGGRGEAGDESPRHTAERETLEEVGLRLDRGTHLGRLSDLSIRRRGLDVDGIISPFLYYLGERPHDLRPDGVEVAAAHWIPLEHLWSPANAGTIEVPVEGRPERKPGIRFGEKIIWGLTYRVLASFSEVVDMPLPPSPSTD